MRTRVVNLNAKQQRLLRQLIDGVLLGDGSIQRGRLFLSQSARYPERMQWLQMVQRDLQRVGIESRVTRYSASNRSRPIADYGTLRLRSFACDVLHRERTRWYPRGKKKVPRDLVLTPYVVAHWFAGDGCGTRNGFRIHTDGFSYRENLRLRSALRQLLGATKSCVSVYEQRDRKQWHLRLGVAMMRPFAALVRKHLPHCFHYKLAFVDERMTKAASVRGYWARKRGVPLSVRTYRIKHLASGVVEETTNLAQWARDKKLSRTSLDRTFTNDSIHCHGWVLEGSATSKVSTNCVIVSPSG